MIYYETEVTASIEIDPKEILDDLDQAETDEFIARATNGAHETLLDLFYAFEGSDQRRIYEEFERLFESLRVPKPLGLISPRYRCGGQA